MRSIRSTSLVALLAVGMALATAPTGASAAAAGTASRSAVPLASTGWWLTDQQDRVRILHGVNLVVKDQGETAADVGVSQDDVRLLVENGFNTVRLGINWTSVEPRPGVIDYRYIDETRTVARMLARAGISVLLDMHQDMYGRRYAGFGHPEWSEVDDGVPPQPNLGFPGNYVAMPAHWRAWDNFWANQPAPDGIGLQDHYAAAWRAVAARFAEEPGVLGYDFMNEPYPGSFWPLCAPGLCPDQDEHLLAPFGQRVADAVREVDDRHIVWYEPWLPFAFSASSAHPGLRDPQTGFTFHNYCLAGAGAFGGSGGGDDPGCKNREDRVYDKVHEHFDQYDSKSPPLLGEFGASTNPAVIGYVADGADRNMISWQYWQYCTSCEGVFYEPTEGQTAADTHGIVLDPRRPLTGDNVDERKLDVLNRPYPQAVAGTPLSYGYDRDTQVFTLRYATTHADGDGEFSAGSVTEVFVPKRQYPHGYGISVEGATVRRDESRQRLYLLSSEGSREVSLRIEPAG